MSAYFDSVIHSRYSKAEAASRKPLRIYFDLSRQEKWHRLEWEKMLSVMQQNGNGDSSLAESPDKADCIIDTVSNWHFAKGGRVFGPRRIEASGASRFVWDSGDFPTGRDAGFYCSLPRQLYDRQRHRSLSYPIRYNECVSRFGLDEAKVLYGFCGGITSGLRGRMLTALRRSGRSDDMQLVIQNGPWNQMFDRSGVPAKQQYAEVLRRSRFFLCPRGNGVGSIRLFETMQAARVPVIIADDYVVPPNINWQKCAVIIREREIHKIAEVILSRADDWPRLAENARHIWEQHFSEPALLGNLARNLRELMAKGAEETLEHQARVAAYWLKRSTRIYLGKAWSSLHRKQS